MRLETKLHDEKVKHDNAKRALAKARSVEQIRLTNGWRYVAISARTQILVPCDKNGQPTKDGQLRIATVKNHLGIK